MGRKAKTVEVQAPPPSIQEEIFASLSKYIPSSSSSRFVDSVVASDWTILLSVVLVPLLINTLLRKTTPKAEEKKSRSLPSISVTVPKLAPASNNVEIAIEENFQGALTNDELMLYIKEQLPFSPNTSLVATSLCCDEVNRPLEKSLSKLYNHYFSMGGLAGTPFGGVTAFGAMAAHIPDGGSCVVVYGPHVGVDTTGAVGTVDRRGKASGGSCCGSAAAASSFVLSKDSGICQVADIVDAQQTFVGNMLLPYAGRLAEAADGMVELPYALFDAQTQLIDRIVEKGAANVAKSGSSIAVLGGIQINTPEGTSDYFLPLRFDVFNNEAKITEAIIESVPRAPITKINSVYPGALPNSAFVNLITKKLRPLGFDPSSSLLCTSLCCDEVNRPLEIALQTAFGDHFSIGGLAGFAFGGATGFGAMAAHIPDNGGCVVVYGPHVGVDTTGKVGTVERRGKISGGSCCGSGVAACKFVTTTNETTVTLPEDPLDAQQTYVGSMLLPYADRLKNATEPMEELPLALFEAQDKLMKEIVSMKIAGLSGSVALVGGIQINTPDPASDYFLPIRFEVLAGGTGKVVASFGKERS